MENEPTHELRVGDTILRLDYDHTIIRLFGNVMLNHIYHETDDGRFMVVYSQQLMDQLHEEGYPQYSRTDNPEWAIKLFAENDDGMEFEVEL